MSRCRLPITARPTDASSIVASRSPWCRLRQADTGIGDRVGFRGLYEWNDLGGLVHWTHHDPHGIEDGGWISHRRRKYA
ncbi:MAG: DUF3465 domain-containing protein [Woeseiaceae bacterium]